MGSEPKLKRLTKQQLLAASDIADWSESAAAEARKRVLVHAKATAALRHLPMKPASILRGALKHAAVAQRRIAVCPSSPSGQRERRYQRRRRASHRSTPRRSGTRSCASGDDPGGDG